jgi:uncharacterized protein DUF4386
MGTGSRALERYAWTGGILYVVALVSEAVISAGYKLSQDDSAAKIAQSLVDHRTSLIVVFSLSILYAVGFVVWLTRLDDFLRRASSERRFFTSWVLIGGLLFVALHSVSDIGIYALLAGKVATYAAQHDNELAYTLYLLTYALDSVADVFASLFMLVAGAQIVTARPFPCWLGWVGIAACPFLFLQAFGLGGVVSTFGLALDLIGFLLLLVFVAATSVVGFIRAPSQAKISVHTG